MKKIILLLCVILAFTLCLASCGGTGTPGGDEIPGGNDNPTEEPVGTEGLVYTLVGDAYSVTKYEGSATEVVIPATHEGKPVTSIGQEAFRECDEITSITIPGSVTTIGAAAFYSCTKIESLVIPEGVKTIGMSAFESCYGIKSITIAGSVTTIEDRAFAGCSKIESLVIPEGVKTIGKLAFQGCRFTNISLPNSLQVLARSAFDLCYELEYNEYANAQFLGNESNPYVVMIGIDYHFLAGKSSFEIPDGTKIICARAFEDCLTLRTIVIPDSIVSIGLYAFYECYGLTEIRYSGSESQWNAVEKELFWDKDAGNFTVMYNYTGE